MCGEAGTGREAVALAVTLEPDVVVIDVSMPGLNGIEATRRLRKLVPSAKVLILTIHDAEQVLADALAAGARGCVLKSESGRTLVTAVRKILAGELFVPDAARPPTIESRTAALRGLERLTGREREVLQLLTEGHGNKEIAAMLGISPKTAETHRARMMAKLGLHSMSDLVRYAIRNRIIQP